MTLTRQVEDAIRLMQSDDIAAAEQTLRNAGERYPEDYMSSLLCRAMADELAAATAWNPDVVVYALEGIVGQDRSVGGTGWLRDVDDWEHDTLACRSIAIWSFGRRSGVASTVESRPGMAQMLPPAATPDKDLTRLYTERLSRIRGELAERCEKDCDWSTLASLVCVFRIAAASIGAWPSALWVLEVARRLYQSPDRQALAAAALMMQALLIEEHGVSTNVEDYAGAALRVAPEQSIEQRAARLAIGNAIRRRLTHTVARAENAVFIDDETLREIRQLAQRLAEFGDTETAIAALSRTAEACARGLRSSEARALDERIETIASTEAPRLDHKAAIAAAELAEEELSGLLERAKRIVTDAREPVAAAARSASETVEFPASSLIVVSQPRGVAVLWPAPNWRLVSILGLQGTVMMEFCPPGETLADWSMLLSIQSGPPVPDGSFARYPEEVADYWRNRVLDGEVSMSGLAEENVIAGRETGPRLPHFAIRIDGDSLLSDRIEQHEIRSEGGRTHILRLSVRGAGASQRYDRHEDDRKPCRLAFVDPSALSVEARTESAAESGQRVRDLMLEVRDKFRQSRQAFGSAMAAIADELAHPAVWSAYQGVSTAFSKMTTDPTLFWPRRFDEREIRNRLDWIEEGSATEATVLEQLACSLADQAGSREESAGALALAARAGELYAANGDEMGVLRSLNLYSYLALENATENRPLEDLQRLLAAGGAVTDPHRRAFAARDLLHVIGKGGWPLSLEETLGWASTLRDDALETAGKTDNRQLAGELADDVEIAFAGAFGTAQPAVDAFFRREVEDVLSGPPLARFEEQPRLRVIYLRSLDSVDVTVRHRFPDGVYARLARLPGVDPDSPTISLEGALTVGLSIGLESMGGRSDVAGASRIITPDEQWQKAMRGVLRSLAEQKRTGELPRLCSRLLVVPGLSAGLLWELKALRRFGLLPETLFVMPPGADSVAAADWERGRPEWEARTGRTFPAYRPEGQFFRYDADGELAETVPFDTLWNGELSRLVLAQCAAEHGIRWTFLFEMDDLV